MRDGNYSCIAEGTGPAGGKMKSMSVPAIIPMNDGRVRPAPIDAWSDALRAPGASDALAILAEVYRSRRPRELEVIFTGVCPFACRHCIYPEDYAKYNRSPVSNALSRALIALGAKWDIDTLFYAGRSVTEAGARLLVEARHAWPAARIGMVDNGISIMPHRERMIEAGLDWIDISLDGEREDHDRQRGRSGSFDKAVEGLTRIVRERWAPRVHVLSCITALNVASLPRMIARLNGIGVRNFALSPLVVVPGVRPDPDLALPPAALRAFVEDLGALSPRLDDAYVEVVIHRPQHLAAVAGGTLDRFEPADDHLAARTGDVGGNEFCIRYFPTSLAGVRELAVNANGDVFAPMSMAHGRMPPERVFGNLVHEDIAAVWNKIAGPHGQRLYGEHLLQEREHLARCAGRRGGG